jgi:aspartate/methionine/tyrosine aminotransferase
MLDQGLVVVPGSAFAAAGHFRLSYAVEEEILERGLGILEQAAG